MSMASYRLSSTCVISSRLNSLIPSSKSCFQHGKNTNASTVLRFSLHTSRTTTANLTKRSQMKSLHSNQNNNFRSIKTNRRIAQREYMHRNKTSSNKQALTRTFGRNKSTTLNHLKQKQQSFVPLSYRAQLKRLGKFFHAELLKKRTLPIPRWITPRHYSFNISELCGHGSFILVAIAYAVDDYLLLRIMAVAGSTSMLIFTYFHPHGRIQWLPFKWNSLFIVINAYRIGKALYVKYMAERLDDNLLELHRTHLPLVELADFAKLVSIGSVEVFKAGDTIAKQGDMVDYMRIVMDGDAIVYRDGVPTYSLQDGNFISESGMHSGLEVIGGVESCATVKARTDVRCIRWDRTELMDLCLDDKTLYRSLQFALCWDIVRKLKNQRNFLIHHEVEDPEQWTIKRKEQTDSRYVSILENILHHHGHLEGHQEQLKNYRVMHQIDDEQHLKALKHCGWTSEEYDLGRKNNEEFEVEENGLGTFIARIFR